MPCLRPSGDVQPGCRGVPQPPAVEPATSAWRGLGREWKARWLSLMLGEDQLGARLLRSTGRTSASMFRNDQKGSVPFALTVRLSG